MFTRLSIESKHALQRPILQILSSIDKTRSIRVTKAFVRWRFVAELTKGPSSGVADKGDEDELSEVKTVTLMGVFMRLVWVGGLVVGFAWLG